MWTTEQPPGQEARCAAAAILRAHFQACGDESMRLPPLVCTSAMATSKKSAKLFDGSLRSLYRSSDKVRGLGAAIKCLSRRISRNTESA